MPTAAPCCHGAQMTQLHARPMLSRYGMDSTKSFSSPLELPKSPAAKAAGARRTAQAFPAQQGFPAILSVFYRRSSMTTPVVLISGALTGIGRANGLAFAQEGAR